MTLSVISTGSACFKAGCRGLPGGKSLFFASPKKSNQKKGDPVRRPLRGTLRCSVQPGSETTRYAQTSFSPYPSGPALFGSSPRVLGSEDKGRLSPQALCACGSPNPNPNSLPHPVEAGPSSADGGGRSGQTCLSRRRVVWTAAGVEQRRLPVATAKGPRRRVAFSLVTFLLAKQKKVTSRRATPGFYVKGTSRLKALTTRGQP